MDCTLNNEKKNYPIEKMQNTKESNWKVDSSYSKEENNFFDCKNQKKIHKNKYINAKKKEKKKHYKMTKKVKEKKNNDIKFNNINSNDLKASNNINGEVEINDNINYTNFQDLLQNDINIHLNKNLYSKNKDNKNLNQNQFSNIKKNIDISNYAIHQNMNMKLNINNINNIYNNLIFLNNNENNFGIKKKNKKKNNKNISSFPQNLSINGKIYTDFSLIDYKGENPGMYINNPFNFENSFGIFNNNNNYSYKNNLKIDNKNITNLNYNLIDLSIDNFNSIQKKNYYDQSIINNNNQSLLINMKNQTNNYKINSSFVEENINKINYLEKSKDKKFIYMSDILKYPPFKINQKWKTPYIVHNSNINNEIDEIIFKIKIKISEKEKDIEIPIRKNNNHLSLLNSLFEEKGLNRNQINNINKEIENVLNLLDNYSQFIINKESNQNINDIYGFIYNKL